ncbi:MAG: MerR family transcriptional regulator, partial [Bauldia sp.]|nr:MerR family transcriptional regulator [Bauldia sp.]
MRTSDLIRHAGVTRKTLRLYEEKALIDPPRSVDNGYREYDREAVERIHTIRLLQAIGFSLAEIRRMIGGARIDWTHTLELQEKILARRQAELGNTLAQLRRTLTRLRNGGAEDDETVIDLIRAPTKEEEFRAMRDTVNRYYNEKAREALANHPATPDEIQSGTNAWTAIIAEVEGMIRDGKDPASPQGQAIVKRMDALIAAFTLGNPDVEQGLNKLYADRANWPKDVKMPYSAEVWDYMGKLRAAARK